MRDAWPSSRVRKNVSLVRTYHGFKGNAISSELFYCAAVSYSDAEYSFLSVHFLVRMPRYVHSKYITYLYNVGVFRIIRSSQPKGLVLSIYYSSHNS